MAIPVCFCGLLQLVSRLLAPSGADIGDAAAASHRLQGRTLDDEMLDSFALGPSVDVLLRSVEPAATRSWGRVKLEENATTNIAYCNHRR